MSFWPKAVRLFRPSPRIRSREWLPRHVMMPAGTETGGTPFSLAEFPHADGPLDAFDDPYIREIVLQWGTRLGKTTLCLSLIGKVAATNPRNMMFAGPTQGAAVRVVEGRLYPILCSTRGARELLLPEHRRSVLHVKFPLCRVYVGWSGSDSSLADVGAYFGIANEIDKWDSSSSNEADPLKLFDNRFKGFTDRKIIYESTPTIKGRSRIEKKLLESKRCRRYCPCPHCGEFQILKKGTPGLPGGFRWDHDSKGGSNAQIAKETAWYECEKCLMKVENQHRTALLRLGVWVPDGCTIRTDGAIAGEPINPRSEKAGFGPLPSWYAVSQTWGDFAEQWINAQGNPKLLQDVVNSYMAETWEIKRTKSEPEAIGERLSGNVPRSFVPNGVEFLTVTVDRQEANGGFCPWVVMGHGADGRAWVIDRGSSVELALIWEKVIRQQFCFEDGTESPAIAEISGVDSGWDAKNTYEFCNEHDEHVISLKGSSSDLGGRPYDLKVLNEGKPNQQKLLFVNTDLWETDLHNRLEKFFHDEPGSLTLFKEAKFDVGFLAQLCNGMLDDKVDRRGNPKLSWVKKEESQPNDFRDCVRYGLCLAEYWRDKKAAKPIRKKFKMPGVA